LENDHPLVATIGVIGPLDVIDTSPFEFYLSAPPGVMFAATSIGLDDFTPEAAVTAFARLDGCLAKLSERQVDLVMLNGIPMLLYLDDQQVRNYRRKASAVAPRGGFTALDAAFSALTTLGVTRPVVADKWSTPMNDRLGAILREEGFAVEGMINRHVDLATIKGSYRVGTEMARELAVEAVRSAPKADGVFLAGGAWLTLHLLEELETRLGVPVISGLQATNWFALNMVERFEPRPSQGTLMTKDLPRSLRERLARQIGHPLA